jgi:uncharacterized membrane protein
MKSVLFDKSRLEAFSDGVFAIIITIMVLEFHRPDGTDFSDLAPLLPTFLAYLLSFVYIAIYWNNHHHLLKAAKGINGGIMWANMGLLFFTTLIPFCTDWLGENYQAVAPNVLYGVILLANALAYYILQNRITATMHGESAFVRALGADYKGKLSPVIYSLAILAAFFMPVISQVLFVAVAVMWIVPDRRVERALS